MEFKPNRVELEVEVGVWSKRSLGSDKWQSATGMPRPRLPLQLRLWLGLRLRLGLGPGWLII